MKNCVEDFRIGVGESLVNLNFSRILTVLDALNFSGVRSNHNGFGSSFIQRLARLDEFGFFEEIGGQNGHAETCPVDRS